jgi:hypothetical protein
MTTGCRDMRGAGVVPNGENGRVGKIDQSGNPGAADEIDSYGASCTDFGRDWLLANSLSRSKPERHRRQRTWHRDWLAGLRFRPGWAVSGDIPQRPLITSPSRAGPSSKLS